jgi:homoprotocatechuate degradation regulator HpaR
MKSPLRHKNLPHLLLQSRETLMARFRPVLNQHGLTEQQWRILRVLLDEDGLEPRQLCERCLISSPSIAGVLMRMEDAGLIKRERMSHDQRRVKVTITANTKKLGKRIAPMIEREYQELEKRVGVKQLQQVYDALDTLHKNLGDPDNATDVAN